MSSVPSNCLATFADICNEVAEGTLGQWVVCEPHTAGSMIHKGGLITAIEKLENLWVCLVEE